VESQKLGLQLRGTAPLHLQVNRSRTPSSRTAAYLRLNCSTLLRNKTP